MKRVRRVLLIVAIAALIIFFFYNEHKLEGIASWYGKPFHGRLTANGEVYNMYGNSAAHKTLPFGTIVKVTRPDTQKSVLVHINDRGPFIKGRIIDLSYGAAKKLGIVEIGVIKVELEVLYWGDNKYKKGAKAQKPTAWRKASTTVLFAFLYY